MRTCKLEDKDEKVVQNNVFHQRLVKKFISEKVEHKLIDSLNNSPRLEEQTNFSNFKKKLTKPSVQIKTFKNEVTTLLKKLTLYLVVFSFNA